MTAFSLFTGNVQLLGWVGGKKDSYKVNGKVLCGTPFVYTYCKLNGSVCNESWVLSTGKPEQNLKHPSTGF